ncbi:MAG: PAS domain S-box protein, partial [Polyangiaceae bacterium]
MRAEVEVGENEIDAEIARAAFGRASEAALIVGHDRVVVAVNDAACRLLGKKKADLEHRPLTLVPDSVWVTLAAGDSIKTEVDVTIESCLVTLGISATANIRSHTHLLLVRDVSERRRREILSERYELLARHTHDIVLFIDRDGRIVEANDAAVSAYGYTREELCALYVSDVREPSTRGDIAPRMEEAFRSSVLFETVHRRKDGSSFPVEVGSRSANIAGEMLLLSVIRDITDRQQIQAGLVQADRLATFGMMAAGIAHEINNPLAYSLTNVDVLARRVNALLAKTRESRAEQPTMNAAELVSSLEQCSEMIATAQEGMGRVRSIVRDLKTFSHEDEGAGDRVDVQAVLDSSINVARGEIRHRARVVR